METLHGPQVLRTAMTDFSTQADLEIARRMHARRKLLAFTKYTKPDYAANWHHAELAKKLDRVAAGRCRRLMVFMPPQHGKSELVSRRFPAFMLGRNPDLRLICASHTHDLAVSMNRDVQRIMTSDAYATALSPRPRARQRLPSPRLSGERAGDGGTVSPRPSGEGQAVRASAPLALWERGRG